MNPDFGSTRRLWSRTSRLLLFVAALSVSLMAPHAWGQEKETSSEPAAKKDGKKRPSSGNRGLRRNRGRKGGPNARQARDNKGKKAKELDEENEPPEGEGEENAPEIDPELKKRIDELFGQKAQEGLSGSNRAAAQQALEQFQSRLRQDSKDGPKRAGGRPKKAKQPAAPALPRKTSGPPVRPGASTSLNIAPIADKDLPPEERMYTFSIKGGTYRQLVEGFARQTGLGVLGEAPRDGKVTFVTTEEMTFLEALNRVRMLLFSYKPTDPYWMDYYGTHLEVNRVTDIYRKLRPEQMFRSIEELRKSNLPPEELALVIYRPKSGSVSDLRQVRDFLPDYVRVAPLDDANGVTLFALVKDIEKYLWLIDFFAGDGSKDPRTLDRIVVQYILPSEAIEKLRQLMDLGGGARARKPQRRGRDTSPLDVIPEPELTVIPEDAHGYILIRAMQDKIDEIKHLLPYVDVETPHADANPVVIPLKHLAPADMVATLQQILSASESPATTGTPKRPTRTTRKSFGKMSPVGINGATLLTHPAGQAIIVLSADEEELGRIRGLIELLDVERKIGPIRIELQFASAAEVTTSVFAVLGGGAGGKGKPSPKAFVLAADPSDVAMWYTGSEEHLERVREMVVLLDVQQEGVHLHIVELEHQKPSFVANVLKQYEGSSPRAAPTTGKGRKRGASAKKSVSVSKFTANDEQRRLFVLCTQRDWERYEPLIQQLEGATGGRGPFVRINLEHVAPETAIDRLGVMLGGGGPAGQVRYAAVDGAILVMGAGEAQLRRIRAFLPEVDRPSQVIQRTFEIKYASPSEIKTAIKTLVGQAQTTRRRAPRAGKAGAAGAASAPSVSGNLTIIPMGSRLIVKTTPEQMEEVARLIAEFDVEDVSSEIRVYDAFPAGADITAIADTLSSLMSAGGTSGKRPRRTKGGESTGRAPRFLPQPASGRMVVIADPSSFGEIENLLDVLRFEVNVDPIQAVLIEVLHADPTDLVGLVQPLLDMKIRRLVEAGELEDPGEGAPAPSKVGKRKRGRKRGNSERYHMAPNLHNTAIIVAASQRIIDEAAALIAQFDQSAPDEVIVLEIVELNHSDAGDMIKALNALIHPAQQKGRPKGRKGAAAPQTSRSGLTVFEAPGGGAVGLQGKRNEVDEAIEWIHSLDAIATRGRAIKVYPIRHADIIRLAELIIHVIEPPPTAGPRRAAPRPRPRGKDEDDGFAVVKTWTAQGIYLQADRIANTLLVATSETRMAEVDAIVEQFEAGGEDGLNIDTPVLPKRIYELQYADAFDASWNLETILGQVWEPADELPKVEAGMFGNTLIIRYPYKDRFPEIEELIRKYVDVIPPEQKRIVKKSFTPPPGMSADQAAAWILMNHPEYAIEIIDISVERDTAFGVERVLPLKNGRAHPCVLPGSFLRLAESLTAGVVGQQESEEERSQPNDVPPEDTEPKETDTAAPEGDNSAVGDPVQVEDLIRTAGRTLLGEKSAKKKPSQEEPVKHSGGKIGLTGEKLKVYYDADKGVLVVEGPAGVVDEVDEWMEELKEGIKDFPVPPDIRIYRVRYINVFSAQDILEEMFNATRQQRQQVQQQQRAAQQQQRAQQLRQQRQQQQQARGAAGQQGQQGRGPAGQQGRPGQPGRPQQQQQVQIAQLPPTQVRVYPNPRDRTLILRAETSQYPAILELLATIDQPEPLDSELKIFKLEKLNAADVEQLLKDMLDLEAKPQARARAGGRGNAQASGAATGPGARLPRTVMQDVVTGTGQLGVDPEDIKLSSNEAANTIIVMAPRAAIELIGELIADLESADIPVRITKHFELKHGDAGEVADYLAGQFADSRPRGQTKREGKKGGASRAGDLNTPSFIPYPRLNFLTVLATAEQMEDIDALIQRIDVSGGDDQWEYVTLKHADAKTVAETLASMFAAGAAPRGKGKASGTGIAPKFIGDEGGRILLFSAPQHLQETIAETIEKLEGDAAEQMTLRFIKVEHAKPSKLAEAIQAAYAQDRGRGGGRRGQFNVTADDGSKRLFVMADETLFAEIESLVATLDQPGDIGFEFRIYPLQYADARQVHTVMTKLMTAYMQRVGGKGVEPFSIEVDERANALVALGGPAVFGFIEENLRKVDTPANAASRPGFLMVTLKSANAQEVAQNINRLWAQQRGVQTDEAPPRAEANPSLNTLMVRGTQAQLDEIKKEFIDPLEERAPGSLQTATITLEYADAVSVAESINRIFEDKKRAYQALGKKGAIGSPLAYTVVATADPITKQIIVQAGAENMALVKARIAELDREGVASGLTTIRIYPVKRADVDAVATIINQWARSREKAAGKGRSIGPGDVVKASAERLSQSVVVTASESNHLIIQGLIDGLDDENLGGRNRRTREVLPLQHANASDLANSLMQLFRQSAARRSGDPGPLFVFDAASNSIVANVNEDELKEVRDLLAQLDTEDARQYEIHVLNLNNADAAAVTRTLSDIFIRSVQQQKGGAGHRISISAVQGSRAILVKCRPDDFSEIEAVVAELDREEALAGDEVRVVSLQYGDAGEMHRALQETFRKPGGRGKEMIGNIRISLLAQSNALVVSGGKEMVDRIEAQIHELDAAGEQGTIPKMIVLKHAKVGQVLPTLQEMFADGRGRRRGAQPPPIFAANEALNALIVRASPMDLSGIEAVVQSLDTPEAADKQSIRIVQVSQGINVTDLADLVQLAVNEGAAALVGTSSRMSIPRITVTPDTRTSSLILAGTPTLFDNAEEMIRAMEKMGPAGGRATRVVRLNNVRADDIQRVIDQLTGRSSDRSRGRASGGRSSSRPRRATSGGSRSNRSGSSRRPATSRPRRSGSRSNR